MDLKNLSEKELAALKNQLNIEESRRAQLEEQTQNARVAKFFQHLSNEMLDALAPEHGRTSCSDTKLSNGFGSNGLSSPPRCNRCALIQGRDGDYPQGLRFQFFFE
jgi:hypothetical protein